MHRDVDDNVDDNVNDTNVSILRRLKWDRCSTWRANRAKPKRALVADSVSRLMVRGRGRPTMGSGQTLV